MRFAILDEAKTKPPVETPAEKPAKNSKPKKTIPREKLIGIIDRAGIDLARNDKLTTDEKIVVWIDMLKWALPLIPKDEQHFKAQIQECIDNPNEKDFIGPLTIEIKEKP